jgi:GrpB-like predicted nucleotidyltransferase (UPF0157 family)
LFEAERELLLEAMSAYVHGGIEHVGSTAVERLVAKPVVDIMVGVIGLPESRPALELLKRLNYAYFPYRPSEMHWLCKPSPEFRLDREAYTDAKGPLVERVVALALAN